MNGRAALIRCPTLITRSEQDVLATDAVKGRLVLVCSFALPEFHASFQEPSERCVMNRLAALGMAVLFGIVSAAWNIGPASAQQLSDQDISDSYIYLLGRLLVTRQQQLDFQQGFKWNEFVHRKPGEVDWPIPISMSPIPRRGSRPTTTVARSSACPRSRADTIQSTSSMAGERQLPILTSVCFPNGHLVTLLFA